MEQYGGTAVSRKIAIGRIFYYEKSQMAVKRMKVSDSEKEIRRFEEARRTAQEQLQELCGKAKKEAGESEAEIFEMHSIMLEDDDFCDSVLNIIRTQETNAEYAVAVTADNFSNLFAVMEDEYMKERAADVRDVSERLIRVLSGSGMDFCRMEEPVILAADDLSPSETIQMDKSKLLGFVTRLGSSNSHTAILARTMNIPALMGVELQKEWNGKLAVLDGYHGILVIDPEEEYLEQEKKVQEEENRKQELLKTLKGKETVTGDGKRIHLYANIGNVSDVGAALLNDAEGIGLFRSEFLYLEAKDFPSENDQFLAYKTVAENMAGKKVIIRTLDIGADKQLAYFPMKKEENPALGYRAIRICLTQREIFKTQLRALLRATAYGNVSVMFPMIISLQELLEAKKILREAEEELTRQGLSYRHPEIGVMIETPAAVMISETLAGEADFFSIGTNDLTQYTLAIDRQNPKLDPFYDPHHPAVLEMIRMTVENGHKHGAWVGICGELGADPELTETFVNMGIDELSVAPSMVLSIRDRIRKIGK